MKPAEEREFRGLVAARKEPPQRTGSLRCRDRHTADDLVSLTIGKPYRR